MELKELLRMGVDEKASDIHITVGRAPSFRINGDMAPIDAQELTPEETKQYARECLEQEKFDQLMTEGDVDCSMTVPGVSRFRVNAFFQRGSVAMVFRVLSSSVPTIETLNLPPIIKDLCKTKEGLILVTGPTGSGKSTTMASIINEINLNKGGHILTLEDPVEYVFKHQNCIVNQREMGQDSKTYARALKASLREDPDVIFIGEMRDVESISIAVTAAETGHLVLSTLHTLGAAKTLDRLIDVFPADQQQQIRVQVSGALKAVISQRLIPDIEHRGRVAAFEIMVVTPAISNLIREGKATGINSCIQTGFNQGMQLIDKNIADLYEQGKISRDDAYAFCVDKDGLRRYIG
ncbi:type IV pilus twitching motility protein PilT [Herbivorax sp. ANBcel31]|uniref:type IV pilus twitching motility protein PilT n=1 Tax=Herbivorax sp. ANBcel31 TaxID=3069754 RepID=UPI0027B59682|nr:type IV pilus twitching motility protein PilT [Herbivorax sp. ANBcel31]MDQ2087880.1 type IV pilus twitching motility protein PilT [Herbivorax sp. ANBcel31]